MKDKQNTTGADAGVPLEPRVRAFRVTCRGIGDGIYFAETARKAKLASMLSGRDAGYQVQFSDLHVRRAPEFDARTYLGKRPQQGLSPEYFDAP
jgi:hypothetical protein